MKILGIMGSVGSGKSLIIEHLEKEWQAEAARLDDVGRELMEKGGAAYGPVAALFGEEVLRGDGSLDRGRIAEIVFADPGKLARLNGIVHPLVMEETLRRIVLAREEGRRLFVIESAILIEAHYDAICNEVWYIYADATTRYSRLRAQRGYSEERIRGIESSQMTEGEYRSHADFVLDNSGLPEESFLQADRRLCILLKED